MDRTVALALSRRLAVGAHPGYADRAHFGRDEMELPLEEVRALVMYQVGALDGFVRAHGGRLVHVKGHGALYNQAAKDRALAVASDGSRVRIDAETICLHGDTAGAVACAHAIRARLESKGILIAPL